MRVVIASLVGLLAAIPLAAQQAQPGEQPREHVVRVGDTLWDLAGQYFNNPFGWRTIYEANLGVVEDPHWIYPTEVLLIPGLYDPANPGATVAVRPADRPLRTIFYRAPIETRSGDQPTVLADAEAEALPVKPGEFHSAEFVANPADLEVLGRMISSSRDVNLVAETDRPTAHPQDAVYLGYDGRARPAVGTRLLLVRPGSRIAGPLGSRVIHPTAIVRVLAHHAEVMEARVDVQFAPVEQDQLVVPMDMFPDFVGESVPVEGADIEAQVVEFVTEQPLYGRAERGFVNVGSRHGVQPGDVFVAYLPERRAYEREAGDYDRIEELPPEAVAELRILRVTDEHATFVVDRLVLPVLEDGIRVRRIRRMP